MNHFTRVAFVLCASSLLLIAGTSLAQGRLLPFQGMLTDSNGQAFGDDVRVVHFKIYDAPISGHVLWNGEVHKLSVNGGMVNTVLGSKSSLEVVDFNRSLYLEITVDANQDGRITPDDPPLLPRQMILPAVFSAEAASARGLLDESGQPQDWSALLVNEAGEASNNPRSGFLPGHRVRLGSLPGTALADGSITGGKLGERSIESRHLAPGSVEASNLDPSMNAALLVPGAIEGDRLADGAVSIEKRVSPPLGEAAVAGGLAVRVVPPFGPFSPTSEPQLIPEAEIEINTTGSPVLIELFSGNVTTIVKNREANYTIRLELFRQTGTEEEVQVGLGSVGFRDRGPGTSDGNRRVTVPLSSFSFLDLNAGEGTHRYYLKLTNNHSRNGGSALGEFAILARELR